MTKGEHVVDAVRGGGSAHLEESNLRRLWLDNTRCEKPWSYSSPRCE